MENCPLTGKPCVNQKHIQVQQNKNGQISEFNCCQECVYEIQRRDAMKNNQFNQIPPGFTLVPLMALVPVPSNEITLVNNLKKLAVLEKELLKIGKRCPLCESTLDDIKKYGKMGCEECYETFKEDIKIILPQAHAGGKTHKGKTPKNNIASLKKEMQKAIDDERYEDAGAIRDKIKELENSLERKDLEAPKISIEEDLI